MNKNHGAVLWQHKIRLPWEIFAVEAVAVSCSMEQFADDYFQPGVF